MSFLKRIYQFLEFVVEAIIILVTHGDGNDGVKYIAEAGGMP